MIELQLLSGPALNAFPFISLPYEHANLIGYAFTLRLCRRVRVDMCTYAAFELTYSFLVLNYSVFYLQNSVFGYIYFAMEAVTST